MASTETPVRHPNTTVTWGPAVSIWFASAAVLILTVILSAMGLLLNAFSAGHSERQSISWAAFDSPAPSSVIIFLVLGAAWQWFTVGWCLMAGAASVGVTCLLIPTAIVLFNINF